VRASLATSSKKNEGPTKQKNESDLWAVKLQLHSISKTQTLYCESEQQRKLLIQAILRAQGYADQLEQYNILSAVDQSNLNPVCFGRHRLSGIPVAIKAVSEALYKRLSLENRVSEGAAMEICLRNSKVVPLIEEFTLDG